MTIRMWWRLQDAAALAEHAMGSPGHRLIRKRPEPALIWERLGDADVLTSSGLPGWHDPRGALHHVESRTWTHTATGLRGVPDLIPRQGVLALHKYLNLRCKFIEQIRSSIGRYPWLAVTALDSKPWFRVQVCRYRDEIAPAEALWVPAAVTARGLGADYPALIADGYTWQGGVLARFTRGVATQIAADLNQTNSGAPGRFSARFHDRAVCLDYDYPGAHGTVTRELDRTYPDADGLYALGAYQWPWLQTKAGR
ncbi:hypothetical protein Lfu02_77140 [Longispora fulva]|uniref:Uncharacterized protein n=1 Tax=Longispora fulva TaxID=619741 RepID=A0A8J7KPD1_9ACTN|nr:hypothetical protein [Longispora fulva]MBG6136167.1 hypothetical protein [Longispora fulva]GIG63342.1 hypothetical protein Lfu02_77140 [Longispora fulva]